jgi:hypothetical protein
MSYTSDVRRNIASLEHSKFVEIQNDTRFPAISVVRIQYPDDTSMTAVSTTDVYPRHAIVTYSVNTQAAQSWDVVTVAVSSSYAAFPSTAASVVKIINNTGTSITIKRTGGSTGIALAAGATLEIPVVVNANEISVVRTDGGAGVVTVQGIATLF